MWPIVGAPDGSFYFDNLPNMLDQFLVNKNMATTTPRSRSTRPPWRSSNRRAWSIQVSNWKPIPFGGMGKPVNQNGFSDHFPITVTLTDAD
jgi:hypothetical protein